MKRHLLQVLTDEMAGSFPKEEKETNDSNHPKIRRTYFADNISLPGVMVHSPFPQCSDPMDHRHNQLNRFQSIELHTGVVAHDHEGVRSVCEPGVTRIDIHQTNGEDGNPRQH